MLSFVISKALLNSWYGGLYQ